jgi:hypothetical protein
MLGIGRVWLNAGTIIEFQRVNGIIEGLNLIRGELDIETFSTTTKKPALKVTAGTNIIHVQANSHLNISAYGDNPIITNYDRDITISSNGKTTTLAATSQAEINGNNLTVIKLDDKSSGKGTAWIGGQFTFNSSDFRSFMEQVGRVHNMEIVYEGKIPKKNVNWGMNQNATMSEILGSLKQQKIHSRIEGKKIIIEAQ